jgi:GH15 family glucan-1,4-alpha-glucosidase
MGYQAIENYAIIGDLHTVALVGMDGSIDFLSFPGFDSPTVFAAVLDDRKGGRFQIAPAFADARQKQLYLPDTNVLLTRSLSEEGVAEVTDFMPIEEEGHPHAIVRHVSTVRGDVRFRMRCEPRFDYGRAGHRFEVNEGEVLFVSSGPDGTALRLRTPVPVRIEDGAAVAEFELLAGQSLDFVLEEAKPGCSSGAASPEWCSRMLEETSQYWREWVGKSTYHGRWREIVNRSALTLKIMTSRTRGSMVAAPTLGLPEQIGGVRNWDYRYTWIRDSAFMVYALLRLGYTSEAAAFMRWIEERCNELGPDGSLQVMYGIDGRHRLDEEILGHLEGYRGSRPVRVGNGAHDQLQLDIYGELMDAVYLYDKYGETISYDMWRNLYRLTEWVCNHWQLPDEGIWEVRGGRHEFLYSRLMCWVAVDRAIRLAWKRSLPAPFDRWIAVRSAIHHDIHHEFWNEERACFVQVKRGSVVDASCLLMPLVRFIGPTDPRWLSTLARVEQELVSDSLVYRYQGEMAAPDGFVGREGTFTMCSFWYVECLARAGQLRKARLAFEKMLGFANHVGLYAEELGPEGEHLGNFPQGFTHLGLISAAYFLDRSLSGAGLRG